MTKQSSPVDLSIIATFHHEGAIAHKTLLNISELLEPLKKQGTKYEIILHADNGDAETLRILKQYASNPEVKLFENHFGSPSASRNFCVQQSTGRYLALIDGDDIFSPEWLSDGLKLLESHAPSPIILHAEYDISFGTDEPRIWHMSDARSLDEDIVNLFTRNRWNAGIMLPREIALKFPYKEARHGFGYEDWAFNMDTRHADIPHKVIPSSVKFYRIHDGSTYSIHGADNAVTAYSEAFATPRMQALAARIANGDFAIKSPNTNSSRISRLSHSVAHASRKVVSALPYVGGLAQRGINHQSRQRGQKTFANLPQPIQDAWIAANKIDGEAWPDPLKLGRLQTYDSDFNDLTALYCRLISQISQDPDYIFLPPQLSIGGTEKVLVNYITAFAELHPDWHIVVLAALPARHPYKIPDNVSFVDFYGLMRGRSAFEVDFILSRFVIQTKAKRLHLIHNEQAFLWAKNHLTLLRDNNYKVYISQFMDEYNKDPRLIVGFVDPWIRDLSSVITKVFTDNTPFAAEIISRTGLPAEKVVAHFQPIDPIAVEKTVEDQKSNSESSTPPLRILWASRVSPQKRPDLLKQIAKKLNPAKGESPSQYLIDAYGRVQRPYTNNFFADVAPIVTYQGTYNGIESLDLSQYDAFLYTSQTDGLPNVLLEIASAGLPIVASNVGGVSDIVNSETGYPVEMGDIDGYVKALQSIRDDKKTALVKAEKAREIVKTRHTWSHFLNQVKRDID